MVKAAYLRNFARYVTWPAHAFADDRAPWYICILGSDLFDEVLEQTLKGRTEQGRPFEVFRAPTLDQLPPCQIVFVGYQNAAKRRAALVELKHKPVLTVGDAPEFLQEGGIIQFQVGDHVDMSVNLDQARSVSLMIQTKMLEVTREVVENGALRRRR
ncbi:MAG: YfiR family protein [Proteobacteria bacterium]|nr:YfiR family protein [Pseudomonadota bacterium]